MKFRLEKEVCWQNGESTTKYWIFAEDKCIDLAYDEDKALEKYENAKVNYIVPHKEIIKEEEV